MASKNVALCPNSFSLSFPKYACSEAFSVHKARRQCKFEGKSHLWISVMYRFSFAKVNAREFLTRFSKYFVLFFMHVNGCQCWYFVWDMHVVFLPSCSMNKTVLQYSRTVEDRLVTKVSWKHPVSNWELKSKTDGSCFNLWKSVSPLLYFLEGCTSNLIQRHIMTSQSLSLTSFFAPEVMPYSFFVGKYVHVLKLFSDESKKKKKTIIFGGNPKPGGS